MATPADAFYRTDFFARRDQRPTTVRISRQSAEIFSRRDRRESPTTGRRKPTEVKMRLPIGITFTYSSSEHDLPAWADSALHSMSQRWGVEPGWDGYSALPTNPNLAVKLLNSLLAVLQNDSRSPEIVPLADGGLQAEWHVAGEDLEIVVAADDEPTYYYFNRNTGEEEDATFSENVDRVQRLVERFA